MKEKIAVLVLSLLVCGVAGAARVSPSCPAKPSDAAEQKTLAREWFSKGETLVREQMFAEAVGAFGCSLLMMEHPATLHNIAMAARESGEKEQELESLERYLELVNEGEKADKAKVRVVELKVELGGDPQEAQAAVAGPEKSGSGTREITENPFTTSPEPEKSALKPSGIAGIAVGTGLIVAGFVLAGLSAKARHDGEETDNYSTYVSNQERMESTQTASIITLSVGAAVLAAGVAMYVIGKKREVSSKSATVTLTPIGLSLSGRF